MTCIRSIRMSILCAMPLAALMLASRADRTCGADDLMLDTYPHLVLRGGGVELIVFVPDAQKGINRAVRFDRAGFVARAKYRGHSWFGPWHDLDDPGRNDNVLGTAGEFGMGTNDMPPPLGFDDAQEGEPFLKIGVGLLRKRGERYRFQESYELIRAADWAVEATPRSVAFQQECRDDSGFAYRYKKQIRVTDEPPGFDVDYELKNVGSRPIDQTYYSHNFVQIDGQPIGPAYRFTFPRAMTPDRAMRGIASVSAKLLSFTRELREGESIFTQFVEHDLPASANGFVVMHEPTGVGLRVSGTAQLARYHFWATDRVACPEPFVQVSVEPGETFRWRDSYELIVKP